jgi:hypothetical protein
MKWVLIRCCSSRLNVFGFPGSPAASKNAGLMDIRLLYVPGLWV